MKRMRTRGWRKPVALFVALGCAGSWATGQVRSVWDRAEVTNMMDKKKTRCVGRLLVDVPEQAETRLSGEMIEGFEIDTVEESDKAFCEGIAARESESAARPTDGFDRGGIVEANDLHGPSMTGRVLAYGRGHSYGFAGDRSGSFLALGMETGTHPHPGGQPVDSSLHRDAALALRDGVLSSIRLQEAGARPGAQFFTTAAHFSQRCLHSDNTECVPDEVMLDISRTVHRRSANQHSVLSTGPDSIAKLVSTLP